MAANDYSQRVFDGDFLQPQCMYVDNDPKFYFVGTDPFGNPARIPVGEEMLSRHMLYLGGIGTGKSNAFNFLIRNLRNSITKQDVIIIFDTKGDYYNNFYRPGDVVISNDDRATGEQGPDYWNLFGEISIDDRAEENSIEIAKTLFAEKLKTSSQPFFPNAAKDLFTALLLHLLRDNHLSDKRNNKSLREVFDSFSVSAMKRILASYPDLSAMSSYIENEDSGQTLGVVAELQQAVREVFVGNFKKNGGLSMRQLVRAKGGRVVFVEYDLGIGSMLAPIYRLLMDLAIKEALCRTSNEGNVYFIIDEFRLLPNLQHIDDGLNFGRSLGAKFAVGVQNVDQISACYGKELAQSIMSGFGTVFSFRVNDFDSREHVKNLFGRNIKMQTYLSSVQNRGITEQIREGYVVEDSDITNLKLGEAIVGTLGHQPFRFLFKKYDV